MEELIVVILQGFFEFILNVLGNIPADWPSKNRNTPERESVVANCFLWFLGGCVLAGISLIFFKHTLIPTLELRIANLVLAPIASAFLSEHIAKRRAEKNPLIIPRNHFWQAFWYTVGLVVIRFTYASRA